MHVCVRVVFTDGVLELEYKSGTVCEPGTTGGSTASSVIKLHCAKGATDLVGEHTGGRGLYC